MKRSILIFLIAFVQLAAAQGAESLKTVFPLGLENQDGNATRDLFGSSLAFQELFRGSELAKVWTAPVEITALAFRVGGGGGPFDEEISRFEIRLSTSSRSPEQMVSSYFSNRGKDERVVFLHDNYRIVAGGNQPVNPFEVSFQFDTPFEFDPTKGNLFMYLINGGPNGGGFQSLDAHSFGGLDSSTPFASVDRDFGAPAGYGFVTEFSWRAVPEPTSWSLALVAALIGISRFLFRKRR